MADLKIVPTKIYTQEKFIKFLLISFFVLFFLHCISLVNMYFGGDAIRRFDFNNERNFPTYFATLELLLCGYFLKWIAAKKFQEKDFYRYHWRVLSFIFYILCIDEAFRIHDRINRGVAGGWVATYLAIVVVVGLCYLFFVWSLPKKIKWLMITSGCIYVGGALGMEVAGVMLKNNGMGYHHMAYRFAITIEESMEFLGLILFIKTLLMYIRLKYQYFEIQLFNRNFKIA